MVSRGDGGILGTTRCRPSEGPDCQPDDQPDPPTDCPTDHPAPEQSRPDTRHQSHSNRTGRSEEHTSELQSLMRISYAVFCLKKKKKSILIYELTITITYSNFKQ